MRSGVIKEAVCTEIQAYNRGKRFPFTAKPAISVAGTVGIGNDFSPNQEVICIQDKCPLAYRCTRIGTVSYEFNLGTLLHMEAPSKSLFVTPTLSPTENS